MARPEFYYRNLRHLFAFIITKQIKNESDESGMKHSYTCTCFMYMLDRTVVWKWNTNFRISVTVVTNSYTYIE